MTVKSHVRARPSMFLAIVAILAAACGGGTPATTQPTPPTAVATAPAAPAPAASAPAAASQPQGGLVASVAHKPGAAHAVAIQPKNLVSVLEVDMYDHYFANPQGEKNPTFTVTAGQLVGIHLHNEGAVLHEIAFGRTVKGDGYEKVLTELVPSDVFFYMGAAKSELGGARYGEIEADAALRDIWIRVNVPAELKGEWEIGCFVPEHYEKGMHAKLVIQ